MDANTRDVAARCTQASEDGTMSFPEIVRTLGAAGIESYVADLRRATKTYYLPGGESCELAAGHARSVAAGFDAGAIEAAIREAQANGPDYSYPRFCDTIAAAGCAFYLVTLLGRRAVYVGRTGDVHVEPFPAKP